MSIRHRICRLEELQPGRPRGFDLPGAGGVGGIIVVRTPPHLHGYMNRCPHTGVNLDWTPDVFLDVTGTLLQCAMHGALFRFEDGYCIFGPCAAQSLTPIALHVREGIVEAEIPDGLMESPAAPA